MSANKAWFWLKQRDAHALELSVVVETAPHLRASLLQVDRPPDARRCFRSFFL